LHSARGAVGNLSVKFARGFDERPKPVGKISAVADGRTKMATLATVEKQEIRSSQLIGGRFQREVRLFLETPDFRFKL